MHCDVPHDRSSNTPTGVWRWRCPSRSPMYMYISIKLWRYFINFVGKFGNLIGYAIWAAAVRSIFLSSFLEFHSAVSSEKSKMSQPIRGQGGHLIFRIRPKTTNLVEDIEILLPVKFLWILFSGFRGEVENVPANQRPGRPSCFSDRPEKHKLGRGCWDLASCKCCWILFSGLEEKSKMSQPIRGYQSVVMLLLSPIIDYRSPNIFDYYDRLNFSIIDCRQRRWNQNQRKPKRRIVQARNSVQFEMAHIE